MRQLQRKLFIDKINGGLGTKLGLAKIAVAQGPNPKDAAPANNRS